MNYLELSIINPLVYEVIYNMNPSYTDLRYFKHLYNPYKKEINITNVPKMNIGPFSEEGPTIKRIHTFIQENGYELIGKHHEI